MEIFAKAAYEVSDESAQRGQSAAKAIEIIKEMNHEGEIKKDRNII